MFSQSQLNDQFIVVVGKLRVRQRSIAVTFTGIFNGFDAEYLVLTHFFFPALILHSNKMFMWAYTHAWFSYTSVFNIFSFARRPASSHRGNNPVEFVNLLVSCNRNLFDMITGELVMAATDDRFLVVLVIFWIGNDCTVAIQIMIITAMCWKPERNIVTIVMKIEDFKICSTLHETWCLISTASI